MTEEVTEALVDRLFREESGRAVATLIRTTGDWDLAEDAVQDAFLTAVERWPRGRSTPRGVTSSSDPTWPKTRRPARAERGDLVLLEDQDRSLWDQGRIEEGRSRLERAWRSGRPGSYSLQAAIALAHDTAPSHEVTDWQRIVALYATLPWSSRGRSSSSTAPSRTRCSWGPERGLARMDSLADQLADYHYLHASRAELLRRQGRQREALAAYDRALRLVGDASERRFLQRRRAELDSTSADV